MELDVNSKKGGTFSHFILLFIGFIAALVGISFLVTSLMN